MNRRIALFVITAWALAPSYASGARAGSTSGVSVTGPSIHHLWTRTVSPNADSAPAFLLGMRLKDGRRHTLVYVVAGNNTDNCSTGNPVRRATTYAFEATSGALVWSRSTTGPSRCTTAGPVADPSHRWVYAPGLDGKMHRYNAATGAETRDSHWPVTVTLIPQYEKTASPANLGNGHLYVTTSGFIGDQDHYEGHLVTIDLATGRSRVFNTLCSNIPRLLTANVGRSYCSDVRSGLFGRGEGAIDPVTHDVYIVSGNGPWNGRTNWGDSVLKLDSTGARLLDSFTPTNQSALADGDLDLGSTGVAILPTVTSSGHTYHLLVQGGKGPACGSCSGVALRLLNRDNLSGKHALGQLGGDLQDLATPGNCEVLTAPAVWTSPQHQIWVFYANQCGVAGYRLSIPPRGAPRLQQVWSLGRGGTTPIVKKGVLYVARGGEIDAYDPTGHTLLWRGTEPGDIHWEYPLVTSNRLYITDESGHLIAYAISP